MDHAEHGKGMDKKKKMTEVMNAMRRMAGRSKGKHKDKGKGRAKASGVMPPKMMMG